MKIFSISQMTSETRDSGFAGAMQRVAPPQKAPAKDANDPLHQHVNSFLRLSLREQRRILIDFFTKSPKRVLVVTNPDIPKRIKSNPQVNVDEKSKGANESIFRKAYRASTAPLKSAQNIYSIAAGAEIAHSLSDEKGFSLTRLVCRTAFHPVDSAIGLSHNILDAALRGKQKTEDDELACSDSEDSECEENCDNDHHLWPQHIDTRTEEAMREELSVGNEASGTILSEPSGEVRSQINVRTFASQFLSVGAQAAETVWVVSTAPVAAVYCTGKRLISNVGNRFKPVSEKPATDDSYVLELPGSAARAREHSSSISTIPNDNVSAASFVYSNVNTGVSFVTSRTTSIYRRLTGADIRSDPEVLATREEPEPEPRSFLFRAASHGYTTANGAASFVFTSVYPRTRGPSSPLQETRFSLPERKSSRGISRKVAAVCLYVPAKCGKLTVSAFKGFSRAVGADKWVDRIRGTTVPAPLPPDNSLRRRTRSFVRRNVKQCINLTTNVLVDQVVSIM